MTAPTQVNPTPGLDEAAIGHTAARRGTMFAEARFDVIKRDAARRGKLVAGPLGDSFHVDMLGVLNRLDDGFLSAETSDVVTARLRSIADEIDSEVLALSAPKDDAASRQLEEAARQFGFESVQDYIQWMKLDGLRRANLLLGLQPEPLGELVDGGSEVSDGLRGLLHRAVPARVLRLLRAAGSRLRVAFGVPVGHDVSCSVVSPGATTPGASDATVQAVGSPVADTPAGAVEPHTPAPARGGESS